MTAVDLRASTMQLLERIGLKLTSSALWHTGNKEVNYVEYDSNQT